MPLETGTRVGPYEILTPLGAGGMGEVWRARDTRLGREVAIKALPEAFARDPERLARFEREAKLLASVNHPNIGAIYGLEVVDGHRYLVLEYIEGESLATALQRGPLPVHEAVEVCAHVAAALEAAHEAGIVHRDLKPGNVMLTRAGAVKVLDFGLAKADAPPGSSSDVNASASPTMTYGATQAGMVLGTAAYMSPEQARGRVVDRRTDIWSLGCVLFECLTGRQAFEGETVSDLIAHILTSEPVWTLLPAATPPRVRELLRRCLEKDARRRIRDAGDVRLELEETLAPRGTSSSAAVSAAIAADIDAAASRKKRRGVAFQLGVALIAALAGVIATKLAGSLLGPKPALRPPVRFAIVESDTMRIVQESSNLGISSDGSAVAYVAADSSGTNYLWVRSMNTLAPRLLHGTENAQFPFFSPDGKSIGFFTETRLKRISLVTGDVDDLAEVKRARGGTWNRHDDILYAPTSDGPLFVLSAAGGEPRQVTVLDTLRGETGQRFPSFLPDGRHFFYSSLPPVAGRYRICIGDLKGGKPDSVASLPGGVSYAAPGWLVFPNTTALMAQRFDLGSRKLRGAPINLRDEVLPPNFSGSPASALSHGGALAFLKFPASNSHFVWCDKEGREIGRLPFPDGQYAGEFRFSPDSRKAAYNRADGTGPIEMWIGDVVTGAETRFESEPVINAAPRFSPDGTKLAWMHSQGGPQDIVVRPLAGGEKRVYLADDHAFKQLDEWTPDGKFLIFDRQAATTRFDLWMLEVATGKARPLLAGPYNEQSGDVSPDGRWLAYLCDETGRFEVYVQPYPGPGPRVQVTTGGAPRCNWMPDGRLSFALNRSPFVQRVAAVLPGSEFRIGPAEPLVTAPQAILTGDIAPDGRFGVLLPAGRPEPAQIIVVLDWMSGLAR